MSVGGPIIRAALRASVGTRAIALALTVPAAVAGARTGRVLAGPVGGTNNLKLSTGTFAMQSTWSNDNNGGGCEFTHRLVTNNWVLNGGFEAGTLVKWTTRATAVLTDNTAHTAVTLLAKTCTANLGWQKVGTTVATGHSYTIRITSHDDNDGAQGDGNLMLVDDVIDK
jgi:hypothetical protein